MMNKISARDIAAALQLPIPTDEQVAIIEAPLAPTLVVAGAGSGKTETMAARVVWLIANELVSPEQVLGLTFTRKAAGELSGRISSRLMALRPVLASESTSSEVAAAVFGVPSVATYNSFAGSLVADHGIRLGVEAGARVLTEADRWQLATEVVSAWDGDLDTDRSLAPVVAAVLLLASELGEHLVNPQHVEQWLNDAHDFLICLPGKTLKSGKNNPPSQEALKYIKKFVERKGWLDLVARYEQQKSRIGALDFSDQVKLAVELANQHSELGRNMREQYRVVLLDEYQDTSYAQAALLSTLFCDGHPVMAVGDPNQAIFGWRGASAGGLSQFPRSFPRSDGAPADVLRLATSWRNDDAILAAANLVATELRQSSAVPVNELSLRPGGDSGHVSALVTNTRDEEVAAVADWIAARWRPTSDPKGAQTAAVLCRARSQFPAFHQALTDRGIPVEVIGLGGLLGTEEVIDLVALLQIVADPSRGDSLLRLLTGSWVNLGAADLFALSSWAKDLAKSDRSDQRSGAQVAREDVVDQATLGEAIANLPSPGQAASDGRTLSAIGHERLAKLAQVIARLRSAGHLAVPELIARAERELHLDVEVALAGVGGRANLDALRAVAANFVSNSEKVSLAAFLAWLEFAEERERGLDRPIGTVNPDAVQLITVHGAKGLEWDVVAVPALVDGAFPAVAASYRHGEKPFHWLAKPGALPSDLRGDSADLPRFEWDKVSDTAEFLDARKDYVARMRQHQRTEERRLAYVALTRAKRELLLSAYWWDQGKAPRELADYLMELADAGVVDSSSWAPAPPEGAQNPNDAAPRKAMWPNSASDHQAIAVRQSASWVSAELGSLPRRAELIGSSLAAERGILVDRSGLDLVEMAQLLLAERDADRHASVSLPAGLSASAMVRLADDRQEFARQLRRPVPTQPTVVARRGTAFHEWVQRHFAPSEVLFELAELDGETIADGDLAELVDRFLRSPWAARTPIAVEQRIYTQIGPAQITAQLDAVFSDPHRGSEAVIVVDWKTGSPPQTAAARAAREVQLAVYRIAWARFADLPIDKVDAAFHYVATGETVRPQRLLTEPELTALLIGE